ncbi:MAG: uncharacterized protein PWP31_557 [Clostridia bacterium]|nr:uncharacterized protein [Clostridia bacterium]
MKIRAHHLLCAHQFRGYGYSEDFVKRLKESLTLWQRHSEQILTIIDDYDFWCEVCPNLNTDNCNNAVKRDNQVLEYFNLEVGAKLSVAEAQKLVLNKLNQRVANRICDGCKWLLKGYCKW